MFQGVVYLGVLSRRPRLFRPNDIPEEHTWIETPIRKPARTQCLLASLKFLTSLAESHPIRKASQGERLTASNQDDFFLFSHFRCADRGECLSESIERVPFIAFISQPDL